jgi:pentapeptide MXKDX repeat protein
MPIRRIRGDVAVSTPSTGWQTMMISRFAPGISAAAVSLSLVLAPAALAQDKMGKDDAMKKDSMMKKDEMKKDSMKKDDGMKKDGTMNKDDAMKKN